jgi:hypothetical protein
LSDGSNETVNLRAVSATTEENKTWSKFFQFAHLPPELQAVSRPFCELAMALVGAGPFGAGGLPRNPERTVALRKLLEAKNAAVRAYLAKDPA